MENLIADLHQALRGQEKAIGRLGKLLFFKQSSANSSYLSPKEQLKVFVQTCLDTFAADHPQEAKLLSSRFVEKESIKSLALKGSLSEEQLSRRQRQAIGALSSWLSTREEETEEALHNELINSLPRPSYKKLFGVSKIGPTLVNLLAGKDTWVVLLAGLGGIGKTALADWGVRQIIESNAFSEIVWLRNEPWQTFTQGRFINELSLRFLPNYAPSSVRLQELRRFLKSTPALIVLDNFDQLEADEIELLHDLSNPSKFLITSRELLPPLSMAYLLPVTELDFTSSLELFQYEVSSRGLRIAETAQADYFPPIYARAGGNPLALRLVAGLMQVWPLQTIIEALHEKTSGDVDQIYMQVYEKCWSILEDAAQLVLFAFSQVGQEGATTDHLQAITKLDSASLRGALYQLRMKSLLEMRGPAPETRYGIHHLTQAFLASNQKNQMESYAEQMTADNLAYWLTFCRQSTANPIGANKHNLQLAVKNSYLFKKTITAICDLLTELFPHILSLGMARDWIPYFRDALSALGGQNSAIPTLMYQLAGLHWQAGEFQIAHEFFVRCLGLAEGSKDSRLALEARLGISLSHWAQQNYKQAWEQLECIHLDSVALKADDLLLMRMLAIQGIVAFAKRQYKIAANCFEQALQHESATLIEAQLRLNLGLTLQADRKYKKGLQQYDKATELVGLVPENTGLLAKAELLRGSLHYKRGKLTAAEAALRRAADLLQVDVRDLRPEALLETELASVYLKQNDKQKARDFLGSAAKLWRQMGNSWMFTQVQTTLDKVI